MKVGDLVMLPAGTSRHWGLSTPVVLLVEKLPRADKLEYDWKVLAHFNEPYSNNRLIELGRQIEDSSKVVSRCR